MSDARKVHRAITGYLQQVLGGTIRDSHIHALAMMITGLIRGKSARFGKIGTKSGATAKYPSRAKQIQQFNKNPHVQYESHYLPLIEQVIASLGLTEYRLSIDTTQVGRGCLLLTIGLVYKQRVIPLSWTVFKGKKGHASAATQLTVLQQVQALLPTEAQVIVTGDGEFDGTAVVTWLEAQPTWQYACRTAKNSKVWMSMLCKTLPHHLAKAGKSTGSTLSNNRLAWSILPLSGTRKSRSIFIWSPRLRRLSKPAAGTNGALKLKPSLLTANLGGLVWTNLAFAMPNGWSVL